MTQPWFDAGTYGWMISVVMAVAGASTALLAAKLGPRGRGRRGILASFYIQLVISVLLVIFGIAGYFLDQPRGVWTSLVIPGVIGCVVTAVTLPPVLRTYRRAQRSFAAQGSA